MATTYDVIASNKRRSALLVAVFVLFVLLVGALASGQSSTESPIAVRLASGVLPALTIAVVMTLASYFAGDQIALWTAGAHPVTNEERPALVRTVENLAITAGLPMPKVYLMDESAINAFATGRDPKHAAIAVTRGALEKLENEELEGVLAHELSHVKNYDIRLMMLVLVLVGTVSILTDLFLRMRWYGSGGSRRGQQAGGVFAIVGLVLLILSPLIARLIQFAVSRRREFLADASGALLTRYPEGLARALEKIGRESGRLRQVSDATAPLYIANPFGPGKGLHHLFSTHPPLEQRIAALRTMGR